MVDPHKTDVRIGVLALQGDFKEHAKMLIDSGVNAVEVRTDTEIESIDGLIIPGGESTTMARLLIAYDLMELLKAKIASGFPVWGTCAGAILLADSAPDLDRPTIGGIPMTIKRNAFGTQVDSFETDLHILDLEGGDYHAIFIRAPLITEVATEVEIMSRLNNGEIVAVVNKNLMATCFHPEITNDKRLHSKFIDVVTKYKIDKSTEV
ncbi:MAG: pyridoxal 5'-phosphate synthase glutaminase subunit PdxT [Chloroflexi bacterium]|nr:pyridoxal 5'-phosphate synthase glutaminase subunit PdxT [Chloroflexota bacterium]|tara:strand:+ start:4595 stop:5218 length:624 start_codon:yes stop_codon:yes gene_type:complete